MRTRIRIPVLAVAAALLGLTMTPKTIEADEGMWLFNNLLLGAHQKPTALIPPRSGSITYGCRASGSTLAGPGASSRPTVS